MKKQTPFYRTWHMAMLCIFLLSAGCSTNNPAVTDGLEELENGFKNPAAEFRTAPLSVWNSKITFSEIERTIKELKDAGFGGVFVHPRPGLITEYLSEEWNTLFKHAVDFGKANGMKVWIYDENSYPSGFAGGHVPAEMPESYNQGQGLRLIKTDLLPENMEPYFICLKKENGQWTDISENISNYRGQKGDYYLYRKTYYGKKAWHGGYSYVDLMVPGVTEKFLEITMKGYEKTVGEEFGKTIPGIFSDEPNIGAPGGSRWTPGLFAAFKEKWGYDLKTVLPLLEEQTGNWKQVRHNYMETLLQLFIDHWSKPYHDYCEKHNLKWTGHYWEHGWPSMYNGPDNMAMYAWHQQPAIDLLFNRFNETAPMAQFGNIRSVKELRSVANQMGYTRTLCETYGGGGWDETLKDLKRLGDWEFALGVNYMNQHLAHMTLNGARKYDYPPVFTYHSPWWQDYRELNDYYGRLSHVMCKGIQDNDILVIEPTSTIWSYYSYTESDHKFVELGCIFQKFIANVEQQQIEYDLGSENIIKDHGKVEKGRFIIGKSDYSMVVLPVTMENLNRPTYELLKQFIQQGGKVVCYSKPVRIDGAESKELESLWKGESVIDLCGDDMNLSPLFAHTGCRFQATQGKLYDAEGGKLYHQHRIFKDGELLFLVNSSMEKAVTGKVAIAGKSAVRLDATNGEIYSYPSVCKKDTAYADFHLEPAESLLLYFSDSKNTASRYAQRPAVAGNRKVPAAGAPVITRLRENALNIDFCDLTIGGHTEKDLYFAKACDKAFIEHGFEGGDPWNSAIQYKKKLLERDTFSTGGFSVKYRFKINEKFDFTGIRAVSERPGLFKMKINGTAVRAIPDSWWLDRSFGVYPIGGYVKKGMNEIELSISPMSIFAEVDPIYIIGDFSVIPEEKGWSISSPIKKLELGSWKEQKHPFYSWGISYAKEFNIENTDRKYDVKLNSWNGTVAEVYVNGRKAGIIYTDPYRLEISEFLKKGKNKVDVQIIGSHKNLLGPLYKKSLGIAGPFDWRSMDKQIPGKEYRQLDYGLMEDFDLLY